MFSSGVLPILLLASSTGGSTLPAPKDPQAQPVLWLQQNLSVELDAAVGLALQDLRRQRPPLGRMELHLHPLDSQCDASRTLRSLFDALWEDPGLLLVLGAACPSVTPALARSLKPLNLLQVSFDAVSPVLSDRRRFPNFFSMVPSDRIFNQAVLRLLQHYGWRRVGLLTQGPGLHLDGSRLPQMRRDLVKQLLKAEVEVEVVTMQSLSEEVCLPVQKLKESDMRIIIVQSEEDSLSQVFCCASRLNMFGGRYQWIVSGGPGPRWRPDPRRSNCSLEALQAALDCSIHLNVQQLSDSNTRGVSGRSPAEYQRAHRSHLAQLSPARWSAPLHAYAYDGVWVVVRALSQVMEVLRVRDRQSRNQKQNRSLSVTRTELGQKLLDAVRRTQFQGVTGPVVFRNGERLVPIELRQFQAAGDVLVGRFDASSSEMHVFPDALSFTGSALVRDRTQVRLQRSSVSLVLFSVLSAVAALVFITTLALLILSVTQRRQRHLKACCGPLDQLLLLGVLLSTASIPLAGLDGALVPGGAQVPFGDPLCSSRLWVLTLGHCLVFGVLFTKMLKVYSLLILPGSRQKRHSWVVPPCWTLSAMLLLDLLVLFCWQLLDPLTQVESQLGSESIPSDQLTEVTDVWFSERCFSLHLDSWLTALYSYKAPQLGLGCFLAWSVLCGQEVDPDRQELQPGGRRLALSVLSVVFFSGVGVLGSLSSSHQPQLHFLLSSILIITCNASVLLWGFSPECLQPGETQCPADPPAAPGCPAGGVEEEQGGGQAERLSRENQQLRRRREQLDTEIETVTMAIRAIAMEMYNASGSTSSGPEQPPRSRDRHDGEDRSQIREGSEICCNTTSTTEEEINSPEQVQRRLSLQLPILHLSYLPLVGGMVTSRSSLLGSPDTTTTTTLQGSPPANESQVIETKDFQGTKTVSDLVKVGGNDYSVLFHNCHVVAAGEMEQ